MTPSDIRQSVRTVADRIPGGPAAVRAVEQGDSQPEHVRHREGPVAAAIEEYTARIPSDVYRAAADTTLCSSASGWPRSSSSACTISW